MMENLISIPLVMFSISMCITPGPNNIMLAASGVNYGFKRSVPHILGIWFGLMCLFLLSALGLGIIFDIYPKAQLVMKILSSLYLIYFACKIALAKRIENSNTKSRPLSFWQAALFQFVNPKALIITSSALSSFTASSLNYAVSAACVMLVFAFICIPSISLWAGFGSIISRFMDNNAVFRGFNVFLGTLTALSVVMIIG